MRLTSFLLRCHQDGQGEIVFDRHVDDSLSERSYEIVSMLQLVSGVQFHRSKFSSATGPD